MFPLDPLPAARRAIQFARRKQHIPVDDGPVGDLVREALVEGLPAWTKERDGFLYLAGNPGVDNLYKIGCTRRSIDARMRGLNGAGVLVPWVAVTVWQVYDAHGLEAKVHAACAEFQIKNELFQAPWATLSARVQSCLDRDASLIQHYLAPLVGVDATAWATTNLCSVHNQG